jgi:hypothetical protein
MTNSGIIPPDTRSAALHYIEHNLAPIPVPAGSKAPVLTGWPALRLTAGTVGDYFPVGDLLNVGLLTGRLNGDTAGEVVVDIDCPEALRAADLLLPETGRIAGRPTSPRSHRHYWVGDAPAKAHDKYRDPILQDDANQRAVLVELLSTGAQVIAPPSVHQTGETYIWYSFRDPGKVDARELLTAVKHLAAAALLARYWPKGARHDTALALAGGLARVGWERESVEQFVEAVCMAAGDEQPKDRVRAAMDSVGKVAVGEKATGWPTLEKQIGENGPTVVRQVREWFGSETVAAEPIIPEETPWPDPPGAEAFYGLPGRIVRTIEPATEADPAALLVQTLVAFGSAAGRNAHFRVEADSHHTNEYAVLVGKTAKARKGTSWGQIRLLMEQAEEQWTSECVASGVSSGEGVIWAIRDPIGSREKVKEKGEVKYVDVEKDPGVFDKRLLLYEPEFANVLKQTERQSNVVSMVLRNAWDGAKVLRTLTKNSPARATGAHVSVVGHITAEELRRYLSQTESANGFANRFLFVCTDRSKLLPEGGRVDPAAWDGLRNDLVEAIGTAKLAGEVSRDDEARSIWCDVYGPLSEGKPGLAGALLARAEAHVMRLALIYALMDRSPVIREPHLMAALALWDYCERSVKYIFGDSLGDDVADELLRFLRGCFPNGMSRTEIRDFFQRHASSARIGKALGLLLQLGLARREHTETGGRPTERWFATAKGRR